MTQAVLNSPVELGPRWVRVEDPGDPVPRESAAVRCSPGEASPEQFLWQGRLHRVCALLSHRPGGRVERWRVRAAAGRDAEPAVFTLDLDWSAGCWEISLESDGGTQARMGIEVPG